MTQRRYAIIGTGGLGGYYGACLARTGLDVHFLLRSDYDHVRNHGLRVDTRQGDFHLPAVNAYRDVRDMPPCDVVVVALKTTQNHLLPALIPPALADDGVVLVLQNGLGIEADVARIVGNHRVIGGLCFLCSTKVGPGHIHHLDYGQIRFAEHAPDHAPAGITDRLRHVAGDFDKAGIPTQLSDDLVLARWQKLVWNVPFNGLSVLLNTTTDRLMADEPATSLVLPLMHEVVAAAKAVHGRTIDEPFIEQMLENTRKMPPYRPSMKVDYDEARPMEVEAIFGNPTRAAHHVNHPSPRLETLYHQLKFLNTPR